MTPGSCVARRAGPGDGPGRAGWPWCHPAVRRDSNNNTSNTRDLFYLYDVCCGKTLLMG
jgi:hypothetical protein